MNIRLFSLTWVLIAFGLFGPACASIGTSPSTLELAQDSQVTIGTETTVLRKTGEKFPLPSAPVLIESPGHVGLLIMPPAPDTSEGKIKITLRPAKSWEGQAYEKQTSQSVNEVVFAISDIQSLIAEHRATEALSKLDDLQGRYPRAGALKFLRASCLLVLGQQERARGELEAAVREFPDYPSGQALLQVLGGGRLPAADPQKKGDKP